MNKNNMKKRISVAVAILAGHIITGLLLFFIQDSLTLESVEELLLADMKSVCQRIDVSKSVDLEPEYAYLLTEYDNVGKNGGYIIADNLHDILCGKRNDQCRTLEDAGIDINKYQPLTRAVADIFGIRCHFIFYKTDSFVFVAYIPLSEQTHIRNVSVFSGLGVSFIIFTLILFFIPLLVQLYGRSVRDFFGRIPAMLPKLLKKVKVNSTKKDSAFTSDSVAEEESGFNGDVTELAASYAEPLVAESTELEDGITDSVNEQADLAEEAEADDEISEYVDRIRELKKAAISMGDDKLHKMADYLEKCGIAILSGSKDADKFRSEIEVKTPIALKYYAGRIRYKEEKKDMEPSEIFAALEALYEGACSSDKNTVSAYINTFSRVNLPRKLDAVFPSLSVAAEQNDFNSIKSIIDSLRTKSS